MILIQVHLSSRILGVGWGWWAEKYQCTTTDLPEVVTDNIVTCSRSSSIRSAYRHTIVTTILHVKTHAKANQKKKKKKEEEYATLHISTSN